MFLLVVAVYAVVLGVVGDQLATQLPDPYMDEIFHVPQARRYCAGNFSEWDAKITTLPGLYLFSVGLLDPVAKVSGLVTAGEQKASLLLDICSTKMLRSINLVMSLINLVLLYTITSHLHGLKVFKIMKFLLHCHCNLSYSQEGYSEVLGVWSSVNMSLCPVLYFYSYLYYTDQAATAMVLLTLCLHLAGRDWLASFTGVLAVLCRQTNIVWVFLCGATAAGHILVTEVRGFHSHHVLMFDLFQIRLHQATTKHPPTISLTTAGQLRELGIGVADLVRGHTWKLMRVLGLALVRCGGYVLVGLGFLSFVHLNNGVVVGDRSAHVATCHLTQLAYFAAFFSALTLPFAVKHIPDFLTFARQNLWKVVLVSLVMVVVIHFNTLAHPYLLADNRHYTFYIWRKIFMRHWTVKYLLTPIYLFGFYHICQSLVKSDLIFKLVLPLCVTMNVVPQLLLEFRYFILPHLLVRAQIKPNCWKSLAIETVMLISVNFVTLYMFLFKPFQWDHEPGDQQRFMW